MLRFIHMILPAAQSLLNNKKLPVIAVVIKMISGQPRLPLIVLYREDHFRETFEFLHNLDVSYLHVFTYSERDNTRALEIKPVVPVNVRHERNKSLRNLSYLKMQHFTAEQSGQTRKVLFEDHVKNGMMEGYTDNYIRVATPYRAEWANTIVDWKL